MLIFKINVLADNGKTFLATLEVAFFLKELFMNDKTKLIENLIKAKKIYDKYLLNKDFLYIFKNQLNNKFEFFEMKCVKSNFLHLTGVETTIKALDFYKNLEKNRIPLDVINYKKNGTTKLKLQIFDRLPLLISTPVQVCFQDNFFTLKLEIDIFLNRPILDRKDIVLGLKQMKNFDFFVPASILKEEPQKIGKNFSRVLFILEKNKGDKKYGTIKYRVKDIELNKILSSINCNLVDEELLSN